MWRYVIADWLAERELQAYAAEAKARGVRWTLAEYRPAPAPAEDDLALLPVFASTKDYEALFKQVPYFSRGRKPKDGGPRPIDWRATRQKLSEVGLKDDVAELDDLRALDAAMQVFLPLINQLHASKATAGNWGDEVWKVDIDAGLPHHTAAMRCLRVLDFRGKLDLALRRFGESRKSIEAQLRLARAFSKTPVVIAHLVAMSGEALARDTIREGLEIGAWDEDALRNFLSYFRDSDELSAFQWSIETERAWSREMVATMRKDPKLVMQVLTFAGPSVAGVDEWLLRFAISRPAWHMRNQLWYERAQDELAGTIDAKAGVWRPGTLKFDPAKLTEKERMFDYALAAQSMNMMRTFLEKAVWTHAQNKMVAIACALELAKASTGKYPDSLESLVPSHLPRMPVDPAGGDAFRYRVLPDGTYRLYSVGLDGEDQEGEVTSDGERSPSDPDWPWFGPRPTSVGK